MDEVWEEERKSEKSILICNVALCALLLLISAYPGIAFGIGLPFFLDRILD